MRRIRYNPDPFREFKKPRYYTLNIVNYIAKEIKKPRNVTLYCILKYLFRGESKCEIDHITIDLEPFKELLDRERFLEGLREFKNWQHFYRNSLYFKIEANTEGIAPGTIKKITTFLDNLFRSGKEKRIDKSL